MKCVTLTVQARSGEDFELLTRMLAALGFRSRALEEYRDFRLKPFFPFESILEVVQRKNPRVYPDMDLTISDPDSAVAIIQKLGLEIVEDHSGPEPTNTGRTFHVRLPGGTIINFSGIRMAGKEPAHSAIEGNLNGAGKTFGVVVSRFNSFITERLLGGTIDGLLRCGVKFRDGYEIVRVPGAFEIPSAARTLAETKKYDAIICLGCLLRGDTAHYDVIVNEVTRGIGQSAQETGVPHAFGVLTCDTLEQAIDRAGLKMGNKGFEAALAAVEMAALKQAIRKQAVSPQPLRHSAQSRLSAAGSRKRIPPSRSASRRNDKSKIKPANNKRAEKKRT
jgi:6,7-dimethyl-8-ribityllumazine synthase